jgi:hypothetical protein
MCRWDRRSLPDHSSRASGPAAPAREAGCSSALSRGSNVLDAGERGAAFVLFALRARGGQNPLAGTKRHGLTGPSGSEATSWFAISPGGREKVPVLDSTERRLDLGQANEHLPRPAGSAASRRRGVGGSGPDPGAAAASRVPAVLADLADERGIRTWASELRSSQP